MLLIDYAMLQRANTVSIWRTLSYTSLIYEINLQLTFWVQLSKRILWNIHDLIVYLEYWIKNIHVSKKKLINIIEVKDKVLLPAYVLQELTYQIHNPKNNHLITYNLYIILSRIEYKLLSLLFYIFHHLSNCVYDYTSNCTQIHSSN